MPRGAVLQSKRRQKLAKITAEAIVRNEPYAKKDLLVRSGYSAVSDPSKIMTGESWEVLLNRYLPKQYLVEKHQEIIETASEKTKLAATKLGYQLHGLGETQHTTTHLHAHAIGWLDGQTNSPQAPPKIVQDVRAEEKPAE